jgi:hypothetical protein
MELPYAGLHQLCAPLLDRLGRLPAPQRDALATVFGRAAGAAPDRFLVGLAALTLVVEAAERQPLACIVDDAQWLRHNASAAVRGLAGTREAPRLWKDPPALWWSRGGAAGGGDGRNDGRGPAGRGHPGL